MSKKKSTEAWQKWWAKNKEKWRAYNRDHMRKYRAALKEQRK